MSNFKKLMMTAAGGGGGLNVEEVFSTYLYTGNMSTQTITNGIDLDGEGGMVWIKQRSNTNVSSGKPSQHLLFDTERGANNMLASNSAYQSLALSGYSFNSDGFTVAQYTNTDGTNPYEGNYSPIPYASWSFRKAPKFFDVVTYTGNGTARTVSHNLGSVPAVMFIKRLDTTSSDWNVYHKDLGNTKRLLLNASAQAYDIGSVCWNSTTPTSSVFSLGTNSGVNANGSQYVAYLFAHNDGDGEFGPTGDQDIIKCGSFNFPASGDVEVDLGWEPQWVLLKRVDSSSNWWVLDNMRGWSVPKAGGTFSSQTGGKAYALFADLSNAEVEYDYGGLTSTGFKWASNFNAGTSTKWVYIAIRRGPMAVPENATDVFAADRGGQSAPSFVSGFPVDMGYSFGSGTSSTAYIVDRLRGGGKLLKIGATGSELTNTSTSFDYQNGMWDYTSSSSTVAHMWRRAPKFFDIVAYAGNGTAGHNITHNLEAVPEMMWIKERNGTQNWSVYHSYLGNLQHFRKITYEEAKTDSTIWNSTTPTETQFTVGSSSQVNRSGGLFAAWLFTTLPGISKVGSYTGTGSNINIDCGFSNGARYILIKRTDTAIYDVTNWYMFDTEQGIVTGNDPYQLFNLYADGYPRADVTNTDYIDPLSSGFTVTSSANNGLNASGGEYIFYAIA